VGLLYSLLTTIFLIQSFREDGAKRNIDDVRNLKLVHPTGTNLRSTELGPGAITAMVWVNYELI